jgi:hypothetical protein
MPRITAASRLKVVFAGMVAADAAQGGAAWAVLQYVLGLEHLGHDVCFVEPISPSKLRPVGAALTRSEASRRFVRTAAAFGLTSSAALLLEGTTETVGMSYPALLRFAREADVVINISGMLKDPALLEPAGRRVYLDLDPGFNQAWHCDGIDMRFDAHTHFATVALAIGQADCRVPTCGKRWITTVPPVVLREWPVATRTTRPAFTTVANWRSYGSVQHDGIFLGQKAHALRPLINLPLKTQAKFALALAIHPSEPDLAALRRNRWTLVNPRRATGTPDDYRRFIRGSRAEFGIAKAGYVAMRTGWFSDRSACYLAAGRPVLAQDTGFRAVLPTSEGLLTFATEDEALAGLESVETKYALHREAARAIAERHCDSNRVLPRLLEKVWSTP